MVPFEYRALDLLADYETRFTAFPGLWRTQIQGSSNNEIIGGFCNLLDAMALDASHALGRDLTDDEFATKLGDLTERDLRAIKLLGDLGLNSPLLLTILAYFASRRNLLDDERCWVRFTQLIDDEISIRAC